MRGNLTRPVLWHIERTSLLYVTQSAFCSVMNLFLLCVNEICLVGVEIGMEVGVRRQGRK